MSLENLKGKTIRLRKSRRFPNRFDPFDWVPTDEKKLESIKIIHESSSDFIVLKLNSILDEDKSTDQLREEDIVFRGSSLEECVEYLKSQNVTINFVTCC
ncbi:hypothetical protein [Methanobacterium sp.]|uniref:hypothetical protein n=1 Tax=Methanobacterium sp. TaxID=2164 RepID=UPI0031595BAA